MRRPISNSEKVWLAIFVPAVLILLFTALRTYFESGRLSGSRNVNMLFWLAFALSFISITGFTVCRLWPTKMDRLKARKRRRRERIRKERTEREATVLRPS